jgi:hypothetical protein
VFAVKLPAVLYAIGDVPSGRTDVLLVPKTGSSVAARPIRRLLLYQVDDENPAGAPRPCYALRKGQGTLADVVVGSLLVFRNDGAAIAVVRYPDPVLPDRVSLTPGERDDFGVRF